MQTLTERLDMIERTLGEVRRASADDKERAIDALADCVDSLIDIIRDIAKEA